MERDDTRRLSVYAMASCGPGILDDNVTEFLTQEFNYTYFVFANNPEIAPCFQNLLYSSPTNFGFIMKNAKAMEITELVMLIFVLMINLA